jgi:hypothetical protein
VSQQELLTSVAAAIDRVGIQYMVTGSIASSLYGEPRLTCSRERVRDRGLGLLIGGRHPVKAQLVGESRRERETVSRCTPSFRSPAGKP